MMMMPPTLTIRLFTFVCCSCVFNNLFNLYLESQIPELQHQVNQLSARQNAMYPQKTLLDDYANAAVEAETRKHDRAIVYGMSYLRSLTAKDYDQWNLPIQASTVCVNIFTSDRSLPYVDALLAISMSSNAPEATLEYAQFNLLNIEHRQEYRHYPHLQDLAKLPFVTIYDFNTSIESNSTDITEEEYFWQLKKDTIKGLDVCIASELPYCLMLEDDTIPTTDFIQKLKQFVIDPIEANKMDVGSISLYNYYSSPHSEERIDREDYVSDGTYEAHRMKTNAERRAEGIAAFSSEYRLIEKKWNWGAVAQLYPREMAMALRTYLKNEAFEKKNYDKPADILMNSDFLEYVGRKRYHVEPSLINHIGFLSERRKKFIPLITDVKFLLDPGIYDRDAAKSATDRANII